MQIDSEIYLSMVCDPVAGHCCMVNPLTQVGP